MSTIPHLLSIGVLTPPGANDEPVSLAEAKLAARVDGTEFDTLLPGLISAARQMAEQQLGRAVAVQTYRAQLSDWPVLLPVAQPTAVVLQARTAVATWATVAGDQVAWYADGPSTVVSRSATAAWPSLYSGDTAPRVRVDITAGWAPADVPAGVKAWITSMVTYWLRNPEAATERRAELSPFLAGLLDPHRTWA